MSAAAGNRNSIQDSMYPTCVAITATGKEATWAGLLAASAPFALLGGYGNLLTSDAHEQIVSAYRYDAHRLHNLKRKFRPDNAFSSATPLPV
jgi:hypothetical protein